MLNITIKVNAYGCRPENGRFPLIVQWYKLVHFMIVLIIDLYLNLFRHLVYTIHISSVALSPRIRTFFGLHIDETSIGP